MARIFLFIVTSYFESRKLSEQPKSFLLIWVYQIYSGANHIQKVKPGNDRVLQASVSRCILLIQIPLLAGCCDDLSRVSTKIFSERPYFGRIFAMGNFSPFF